MARSQKPEEAGPSKAYLVSFGDTMTTLLAFFIVLCSLAEDQTGMNLYRGTGSFIQAMEGFGLPGILAGDHSAKTFQMQATSPLYLAAADDDETPDKHPSGPDAQDNQLRSIDREQEEFKRFLNEMERQAEVQREAATSGETTFDFFGPLNSAPPLLSSDYADVLSQVLPLLRRESHRVDVVVWATTPSPRSWRRAAEQAEGVSNEIAAMANLNARQRPRLRATARPWIDKDAKRPVISITMRRVEQTQEP